MKGSAETGNTNQDRKEIDNHEIVMKLVTLRDRTGNTLLVKATKWSGRVTIPNTGTLIAKRFTHHLLLFYILHNYYY